MTQSHGQGIIESRGKCIVGDEELGEGCDTKCARNGKKTTKMLSASIPKVGASSVKDHVNAMVIDNDDGNT